MGLTETTAATTWHAFLVIGLIFPLHIVAGVLTWPALALAICCGSTWAICITALYLPFFLYVPHCTDTAQCTTAHTARARPRRVHPHRVAASR